MWKRVLGTLWRGLPKQGRRWLVLLAEPRFTVTAGAVVTNERGEVLLLNHVFRKGSGWGIPGGFLDAGEQPEEALRRELREETGLTIERPRIVLARTHRHPQQVEIIYRCRVRDAPAKDVKSLEVNSSGWFAPDALPPGLSNDQRRLIERALQDDANSPD